MNHVNTGKLSAKQNRRESKLNRELLNSPTSSNINNSLLADDLLAKSNINQSFYLTAPRASPEISDVGDNMSINNTTPYNTQNDQIEPVLNNNNNDKNLSSINKPIINFVSPISNDTTSLNATNLAIKPQKRKTDFNVNFDKVDSDDDDDNNDGDNSDYRNNDRSSSDSESEIDIESLANNIHDKKKRKRKKLKKRSKGKKSKDKQYLCCTYVTKSREAVKSFVNTKIFIRGILGAILINTLSMGVEHHDQPYELTMVVEYSNILFTSIFFIEMLLKLYGEGIFDYIKNAYNVFDGVIVGLR